MERALVVLETDEDGPKLLREAGGVAPGTGANLDVLALMTSEWDAENRAKLEAVGEDEHTTVSEKSLLDGLRRSASRFQSNHEGLVCDFPGEQAKPTASRQMNRASTPRGGSRHIRCSTVRGEPAFRAVW